ncbi:hypothetical protein N7G274_009161 [Stereocaulon virgatum]|uniref:Uncharacterized protein n=1 Tax=Stereocaulon virgatum TaxID=373712 RepID=A0ABR4A4D7_9LECA
MTRAFLEDEHYGVKDWPSKGGTCSRRVPQYPRDNEKIIELLKQLFGRQNMHGAHNAKHPDRSHRTRESVESDATLMNTSAYHSCFFDSSNQCLRRQDSGSFSSCDRSATSPQSETFDHGLRSPPCDNIQDTARKEDSLSPMHLKWNNSNVAGCNASMSGSKRSAPLSGMTRYIALPEPDEDIFDYDHSDNETRQQAEKSNKIVVPRCQQQDVEDIIADLESDHIDDGRVEVPRPRGIAPEARKIGSPAEATIHIPAQAAPKAPLSRSKPSAGCREAKRKIADDDDDAEYTPSKKVNTQDITSYIAITKPSRRIKHPERDNDKSTASVSDGVRVTERPSASAANIPMSPVVVDEMTNHSADPNGTPTQRQTLFATSGSPPLTATEFPTPKKTPGLIERLKAQKRLEKARPLTLTVHQPNEISNSDQSDLSLTSGAPHQIGESQPREFQIMTAAALNEVDKLQADGIKSSVDTAQSTSQIPRELPILHTSSPEIEIRYSIIVSRSPRFIKRNWPIQSLTGKTVKTLFDEVAKAASKTDIQRIDFKLSLTNADSEYTIERNDARTFEAMKHEFADDIMADWQANDNTKFSIWVEPDPMELEAQVEIEDSAVESIRNVCPRIAI